MTDYGFEAVDAAADPSRFAAYLDAADAHPSIRHYKQRALEALGDIDGAHILDVGCGVGSDVRALAARMGTSGRVVGLDRSSSLLEIARERAGSSSRYSFVEGDIEALPFESATFDVVRFDRVLIHVSSPEVAVREAARVLKPGGRLLALEGDFDTLTIAHPHAQITRRIVHAWTERYPQATIGRALPGLLRRAELADFDVHAYALPFTDAAFAIEFLTLRALVRNAVTACVIDPLQAAQWWVALEQLRERDELFAVLTGIGVVARVRS